MSDKTGIEWTDSTWNPVTGCTRVSPGCAHCYIETTFPFRNEGRIFDRVGDEETTGVRLHPERLERVPKGPRVFVCSLADLFHEDVPDEYIARVFDTMRLHPNRTFQVLTKRPERALDLVPEIYFYAGRFEVNEFANDGKALPNVWLGVSIENARYTWRADVLREIPAAVRFISAEPLLGSLFAGAWSRDSAPAKKPLNLTGIDWLIVGGESGGRFARPMHPTWARELRDACLAPCDPCAQGATIHDPEVLSWHDPRTAFFFKQWGSWEPADLSVATPEGVLLARSGQTWRVGEDEVRGVDKDEQVARMRYAGASPKSGGKLLDGREWCEFPRAAEAVPA